MKNIIIDGIEYTPIIKKEIKPIILNQTITLNIEVYPTDLGEMTWNEAVKACNNLGDGWRLPTKKELGLMYLYKSLISNIKNEFYWSSTELDLNLAWFQYFGFGNQNGYSKYGTYYVRAVRSV